MPSIITMQRPIMRPWVSAVSAPTAPTVSASRIDDTTIRFTFTGGSGATSWTGYYRTPDGSGSYTSESLTVGQAYSDVTVSSESTADYYVAATNAAGTVNSSVATGSAASGASPLFSDDFSTGDLSTANDYFRWGEGGPPSAGYESDNVVDVTGPLLTTIKARHFPFGKFEEQRFHLTTSLAESRSANGNSNTAYKRVCIGFDFYVPSNYMHRNSGSGFEGVNNKWLVDLWKDGYGHSAEISKVLSMTEAWRISSSESYLRVMWSNPGSGAPSAYGVSDGLTAAASRIAPGGEQIYAVKNSDKGKWARIVMDTQASDIGSTNGWARWYRAEYTAGVLGEFELMVGMENMDNATSAGTLATNGFDRGYLMGYSNSGFDELTTFYIANFEFGLTPESVGWVS